MRYLSFIAFLALSFAACHEKTHNVSPQPWVKEYVYVPGFEIVIANDTVAGKPRVNYGMQKSSNKMVFRYTCSSGYGNDISDDEYISAISFEIAQGTTSFSYSNEELAKIKANYMGGGAWSGYPVTPLTTGTIKGQKTGDSTWQVEIVTVLTEKDQISGIQVVSENTTYKQGYFW